MRTIRPPEHEPPVTDSPVYWFVKLEVAVLDGDFGAAAAAQQQLERLGVIVRYGRPGPAHRPRLYEVSDAR